MPTDRSTLRTLRAALCPDGVLLVDPALHPAARGAVTGLVLATGSVTVEGRQRSADELDTLLAACLARGLDAAPLLPAYAVHVLATCPSRPDRLTGRTAVEFLDTLGEAEAR
jgi:hypothetical protein